MRNLADLKREAKLYAWEQVFNSWFPNGSLLIGQRREVSRVLSARLTLKTVMADGGYRESWLDFPKASEMVFADTYVKENGEKIEKEGAETLLIIEQEGGDKKHVMVYRLHRI